MKKKILLSLGAVVAVVASVAAMSAYEAHVINVTAHIENALSVDTNDIAFGTVFPQEYVEESFTISMSQSFIDEDRADDIDYVIHQKPKCKADIIGTDPQYLPVNYWNDECPGGYTKMLSLCPFLSKIDGDPDDQNDLGVPSYFEGEGCADPAYHSTLLAMGRLAKSQFDTSDTWIVDLKVPPVKGTVGQDWPASCAEWTVPEDSKDYGCDLWIEITGISRRTDPTKEILSLENKHGDGWFITVDNTYGALEFNKCGTPFAFNLTAQGLTPGTDYSLIYYADGWPGNNPGGLIWSGMTDVDGKINTSGSKDLGINLPDPADANHPVGAKIWLIPSSAYNAGTNSVTAWPYTQMWLFEHNLINYRKVCP